MAVGRRVNCRADVVVTLHRVRERQIRAVLLLQLVEPRSVNTELLGYHCVDTRRRVIGLRVLAELNQAQRRESRVWGHCVIHSALDLGEFRIESDKTKNVIFPDWPAERKAGKHVAALVFLSDIGLISRIDGPPACGCLGRIGIQAGIRRVA